MAHVATYTGAKSAAVSWAAGDVLVAVLALDKLDSNPPTLAGWTLQGSESQPSGEYIRRLSVTVWTRVMTSAGSAVVAPSLNNAYHRVEAQLSVGRYTASRVAAVSMRRVQAERPQWPASPVVAAGDVVHAALLYAPAAPAGATVRDQGPYHLVADRATSGVVSAVGSSGSRTDGVAWTVHLASTPQVATPVVDPLPSGVEVGAPVAVSWQPVDGQTAYSIRRSSGSSHQYWSGSAWTATETRLSGAASSATVTLPAGTWVLSVRATAGSTDSAWSDGQEVVAAAAPAAPTVVVSSWTVRRPTITVTGSAGAGATLAGYRIEVLQGSTVLESVLDVDGAWQPARLPDGPLTIRAAIVQNGDQQGPWASVSGTVAVPPIPAPTVTAEVQYLAATIPPDGSNSDGLPGVRLTITTSLPAGVLEVSRDGEILAAGQIAGTIQVDDFSPGGAYRVRVGDLSDPTEWSPWTDVVLPELGQEHWIVPVQYPELAVRVVHRVYDEVAPDLRTTTSKLLDSSEELLTFGVPVRARRRARVSVESRWAWERLSAILSSGWLLRMAWCASTDGTPTPTDIFRVDGFEPARMIPTRNIDWWDVDFDIIPQSN